VLDGKIHAVGGIGWRGRNAAPDGYTLLMVTTVNAINATLYEKLKFKLIRDLTPGREHASRSPALTKWVSTRPSTSNRL
jgi:tripartite-type tricarboxylate transporter receptor subunit TctC